MNYFLIAAAVGNGFAVLLHIGCIYFGAAWYRFFGAGEQMALWADQGSLRPTIITSFIIVILGSVDLLSSFLQHFVWGLYKAEPMWCSWLHE